MLMISPGEVGTSENGKSDSGRKMYPGTHEAMASYRVMAIAMAIGEAAGIGAALAIDHDVTPENLDVKYIQKALMDKGAVLFDEK